jgi:hypothetical protein
MYHDLITVAPMPILQEMEAIRPVFDKFIKKNLTKDEMKSNGVFLLYSTINGGAQHFALMIYPHDKSYYAFITPEEQNVEKLAQRCGSGFKTNVMWKEFLETTKDLQGKDFGHFLSKHLTDLCHA